MNEPKKISELLSNLKTLVNDSFKRSTNIEIIDWSLIVDKQIYKHSQIDSIYNNTLVILVDSSAYLFKISLIKDEILIKLKEKYSKLDICNLKLILKNGG